MFKFLFAIISVRLFNVVNAFSYPVVLLILCYWHFIRISGVSRNALYKSTLLTYFLTYLLTYTLINLLILVYVIAYVCVLG